MKEADNTKANKKKTSSLKQKALAIGLAGALSVGGAFVLTGCGDKGETTAPITQEDTQGIYDEVPDVDTDPSSGEYSSDERTNRFIEWWTEVATKEVSQQDDVLDVLGIDEIEFDGNSVTVVHEVREKDGRIVYIHSPQWIDFTNGIFNAWEEEHYGN